MVAGWQPPPVSKQARRAREPSHRIGSAESLLEGVGTGSEELLVPDPNPLHPEDWSLDNRWIAYTRNTSRQAQISGSYHSPKAGNRFPFRTSASIERDARFSPDSRWIAFVSTEAGQPEVYVAPVGQAGARKRISVGGGTTPRWGDDGGNCSTRAADNRTIMQVPIQPGSTFAPECPRGFSRSARRRPPPAVWEARLRCVARWPFLIGVPAAARVADHGGPQLDGRHEQLIAHACHRSAPRGGRPLGQLSFGSGTRPNLFESRRHPSTDDCRDWLAADERPVLAPEILDHGLACRKSDARVTTRNRRRVEIDAVVRLSPKDVLAKA